MTVGFVRLVPNVIILIIKLTIDKMKLRNHLCVSFLGFDFGKLIRHSGLGLGLGFFKVLNINLKYVE